MQVKNVVSVLEKYAPLSLQEDYDNSGLIVGDSDKIVTGILITVDIVEETIDEAINVGANFIISHHPLIFSGLKKITGNHFIEKILIKAIKNDIAIYSSHTNLDNIINGVNGMIASKLKLSNCRILHSIQHQLSKVVTYVPVEHAEKIRKALFEAGCGNIGNYDYCSFNIEGQGTFRGNEKSNPFVGIPGKPHVEKEMRIESVFPSYLKKNVVEKLLLAHPYEEVAYDIYTLENESEVYGSGLIGNLENEINEIDFLEKLKEVFSIKNIKHSKLFGKPVKKVALCGGSGSFLLKNAISKKADIFISSDFKYHQFFEADNKIIIADIGHYESEQFTKEIFYDLLTKNFSTFAIHLSKINTNPINYY